MTPETHATMAALLREFIDYWTKRPHRHDDGGCGMCGGQPHTSTCFVGRIDSALAAHLTASVEPQPVRHVAACATQRSIAGGPVCDCGAVPSWIRSTR